MKNPTDYDTTTQQPSSTDHSETRVVWIGLAFLTAFFILDWLSGWQI